MTPIRSLLCLPLAAFALTAALPRARACVALPPGVQSTIPADGEKYPANAAVILRGTSISLTDAAVTVDGQPASLKDVSQTRFSGLGLFAVTVEPTPSAGQAVVITGTFCGAGATCPPVALHYETTAADTTPPTGIDLAELDIHDYQDIKSSGGICQSDSDFAWWLQLKSQIPDQAVDGAVIYSIEGYRDASLAGGPVVGATGFITTPGTPLVAIRRTIDILEGKPLAEALCFRVKAYDSAGNPPTISPELLCKPCNYRVDSAPSIEVPPPEPTWTAADIYPGGPCDFSTISTASGEDAGAPHGTGAGGSSSVSSGAGGGGNDDVAFGGCGCRMVGGDGAAPGLAGALTLAIGAAIRLARRRRR